MEPGSYHSASSRPSNHSPRRYFIVSQPKNFEYQAFPNDLIYSGGNSKKQWCLLIWKSAGRIAPAPGLIAASSVNACLPVSMHT